VLCCGDEVKEIGERKLIRLCIDGRYVKLTGKENPMRKTIIRRDPENVSHAGQTWLDLDRLARIEFTSEETAHPVEAALVPGRGAGWRAEQPGEQTIRLIFEQPMTLGLIHLRFDELEQARTQEFALRWLAEGGEHYREIVRQQYTFSPPGMTQEIEDYRVELSGVTELELRIVPDISGGNALATLTQMSLA
jgi:hypothetical protein